MRKKARQKHPDADLEAMDHQRLLEAAKKMRAAIRAHRDSSGHDLCWYHPELWSLLPDRPSPKPHVPEWAVFMQGCIRYRASLDKDLREAPRTKEAFST